MTIPIRSRRFLLVAASLAFVSSLVLSFSNTGWTQQLFLHTTYYCLLGTVLCWVGLYLHLARDMRPPQLARWLRENWPGIVIAAVVTTIAAFAIEPALRILSDEANLAGTAKNLFAARTPTFTVSGKYYYDSYWDVDVAIDRRPTLFPFLVSLVHTVAGYSYKNVFTLNLLLLAGFLLIAYRLAKSLGGETFGVVAALLVVAHPIALVTVRSGAFDFCAAFFSLLSIKSVWDFARERSPGQLAALWLNLCLLAEVRYETALFILPVVAVLVALKLVTAATLRPYAFVYAASPLYLLPRVWQSILRGNVPEQDPGTVTFSLENFLHNAHEYVQPILDPWQSFPSHSALLIGLGLVGYARWLWWLWPRVRNKDWSSRSRFALVVAGWLLTQAVILFTYTWGRAQYPSAARLFIALDAFLSFGAAWVLTSALERFRPFVSILVATAVLLVYLPVAAQHRMLNRLTQTRESAATWSFFERLGEKRILIVTDRPNHFTIMSYGAMSFESARSDPYLLTAWERHLFQDVYVIQRFKLSTKEPLPGYDIWRERRLETVLEFQNDADELIRVSRLAR